MPTELHKPRFPRWLIAVLAAVVAGVLVAGIWFYRDQEQSARREAEDTLSSIAELKVDQIAQWRAERLADAGVISGTPLFAEAFTRWLETGQESDRQQLFDWLQITDREYRYSGTLVADTDGTILISSDSDPDPLTTTAVAALREALERGEPLLTDLHLHTDGTTIHLDAIAPLYATDGTRRAIGAAVMHIDASQFLFPLIQEWPTPSDSAETLLVRREGDSVLFLNELRFQSGTALKLSFPLSKADLPAIMAVEGRQGIVQAPDYRDVMVLADIRAVPDSPWFMVAKVDMSEVLSGTTIRAGLIFGLMAMLVVAIVGGSVLVWQLGLKRRYREAYAAEAERRSLLERLEHLVKEAGDIILVADEKLNIVEANDLALESYGYSRDQIIGMRAADLLADDEAARFEAQMAALDDSEPAIRESLHKRSDGSTFPVELSRRAITINGKRYFQAIARDISARRHAEEMLRQSEAQLRQAQKMEAVGQLAGGIAHDFNNLLTAILGYCELTLERDELAGSPALHDINQVKRAAERAGSLTKQILAFSRRQPLQPKVVSLNQILDSMEPLLRRTLGEDIDLVTLRLPDLGHAELDVHQFEQVLINLALNARDAMPGGGRLTLETSNVELDPEYCRTHPDSSPGKYVSLAVSDTGIGMDEETLARVFEPFFTTKGAGEGTGLGLAMVYGVVRQSGGNICVYSEPGKGTSFKIYLPRVDSPLPIASGESDDGVEVSGTETILVVEDESALRELVTRILADAGFQVMPFASADEALVALQHERQVDLVVTDVVLPGVLQGNELAAQIASLLPGVPVLYMSGYTRNAIVHAGRLDAGVDFLEKPFTPHALLKAVRTLLDRPADLGA